MNTSCTSETYVAFISRSRIESTHTNLNSLHYKYGLECLHHSFEVGAKEIIYRIGNQSNKLLPAGNSKGFTQTIRILGSNSRGRWERGMEAVLLLITVDAVDFVDLQSSRLSFHFWTLSSNFITVDYVPFIFLFISNYLHFKAIVIQFNRNFIIFSNF